MQKIPSLAELLQAGAHFGHRTSKWHPKMKKFIMGSRQGIHIIDLEETRASLERALAFAKQVTSRGGVVLFVGTKKQASDIVEKAALDAGMPYVNRRWLGGTLTNFAVITAMLRKYKDLKRKQEKGELGKYTKYEQLKFDEQIKQLEDKIGGIKDLGRIPDAVFILDIKKDKTALIEATRRGVKVIALCDTNVNPTDIDYAIVSNDDAIKTIDLMANIVAKACKEGREEWEAARARLGNVLTSGGPQKTPTNV
ncbi:30S ribosomal protein S2 [Candidatus Uhrbacteria bacterium]|nr:30S ribosomal protein S2 [Candidatus Uhrbacteria bacterium]